MKDLKNVQVRLYDSTKVFQFRFQRYARTSQFQCRMKTNRQQKAYMQSAASSRFFMPTSQLNMAGASLSMPAVALLIRFPASLSTVPTERPRVRESRLKAIYGKRKTKAPAIILVEIIHCNLIIRPKKNRVTSRET